jgi:hypothetical protein
MLIVAQLVKKFPTFYGTRRFITMFPGAHPMPCVTFRNKLSFYGEELLASRQTSSLEDHPLLAVRDYLFNVCTTTLLDSIHTSVLTHFYDSTWMLNKFILYRWHGDNKQFYRFQDDTR